MKRNKIRLFIIGSFFAIYGLSYVIIQAFQPFSHMFTMANFRESFLITMIIMQVVALIVVSVLVVSVIFSTSDFRNRWFYLSPVLIIGLGLAAHTIWPLNSLLDYVVPVALLLLGTWMVVRAVKNQISPKPQKVVTERREATH